ncbi:MAG: ATP-binding protein [Bacillus subtilis]|nr:ATP-binding protein [Bacillus subtilis]
MSFRTLEKPIDISKSVLISVQDDGIGISKEDMSLLFKRFALNKGRKPSGTGLGLYYSHQVISKHKGFIGSKARKARKRF